MHTIFSDDAAIRIVELELPEDRRLLDSIHIAYDREYGFTHSDAERDHFAAYLAAHRDIYHPLALLLDNEPAGYIRACDRLSTSSCDTVSMLDLVYILPEHRGKKLGRLLMDAYIRFVRESGHARIDLLTDLDNPAAVSLYESLGFRGRARHQMILFLKDNPTLNAYLDNKIMNQQSG